MHFDTKCYLKSTLNHTAKHALNTWVKPAYKKTNFIDNRLYLSSSYVWCCINEVKLYASLEQ